jgi:hypothetical protein
VSDDRAAHKPTPHQPSEGSSRSAAPTRAAPTAERVTGERSPDARMARLHLRVGLLSLARAELETMAGDGTLDVPAMADLAEVRWRTGDLPGAGEAAVAHIGSGGSDAIAYVVAAESYAAQGRSGDATRMASEAIARGIDVDTVFAGEPQSAVWNGTGPPAAGAGRFRGARPPRPTTDGMDGTEQGAAEQPRLTAADVSPALAAARGALRARDPSGVASRLAVALRADLAEVAEAVLEIADAAIVHAGRLDAASLHLIRGDALTLLDRPEEAAEAYNMSNHLLAGRPDAQ